MTPRGARILWLLALAGLVLRLGIAFASAGSQFDIASMRIVDGALRDDWTNLYSAVNFDVAEGVRVFRWPYPPLFFPWILLSAELDSATGLAFHGLVSIPAIVADLAIAWFVQDLLGRRGADERWRLAAATLVLLGPVFITISGYHGQIDSLAILPAVAAVWLWDRSPASRPFLCGALIGVGAALKIVPGLVVLALLPTARDLRQRAVLIASAVAVPALVTLPFLLTDARGVLQLRDYHSIPGLGGLTMFVQPELTRRWLVARPRGLSDLTRQVMDWGSVVTLLVVLVVAVVLIRRRTPPVLAASVVFLTFYLFSVGFAYQYLVWALPFFLMAGSLRAVAVLQLAMLVPMVIFYGDFTFPRMTTIYVIVMTAIWIGFAVAWAVLLAGRRWPAGHRQPVAPAAT